MMAHGFAVIVDGEPVVRTVMETERATLAEALMSLCRFLPTRDATHAELLELWTERKPAGAEVRPVSVSLAVN